MVKKISKKPKAKLYLYLDNKADSASLKWFLVNETDIMLMGENLSDQLTELAKQYKTYAIIKAKNSSIISIEAPMGIKKSDYPLLLEDQILTPIEDNFITLLAKHQSENGGQVLDFILLSKSAILAWNDLFAKNQIQIADYYLESCFFKQAIEQGKLPYASEILTLRYPNEQDLIIYKDALGRLTWLYWNKNLFELPPYIEKLYKSQEQALVFSTPYEMVNQIIKNNYSAISLDVPKPKRQGVFANLAFLKKIKMHSLAFLKQPVFIFSILIIALYTTDKIMQTNLAQKNIQQEFARIESLKLDNKMPTAEFINRIEKGAINYPKAERQLQKINSIINKLNANLTTDILPVKLSWDTAKLSVVLSFANENALENITKLADSSEIQGSNVTLEFNL